MKISSAPAPGAGGGEGGGALLQPRPRQPPRCWHGHTRAHARPRGPRCPHSSDGRPRGQRGHPLTPPPQSWVLLWGAEHPGWGKQRERLRPRSSGRGSWGGNACPVASCIPQRRQGTAHPTAPHGSVGLAAPCIPGYHDTTAPCVPQHHGPPPAAPTAQRQVPPSIPHGTAPCVPQHPAPHGTLNATAPCTPQHCGPPQHPPKHPVAPWTPPAHPPTHSAVDPTAPASLGTSIPPPAPLGPRTIPIPGHGAPAAPRQDPVSLLPTPPMMCLPPRLPAALPAAPAGAGRSGQPGC